MLTFERLCQLCGVDFTLPMHLIGYEKDFATFSFWGGRLVRVDARLEINGQWCNFLLRGREI